MFLNNFFNNKHQLIFNLSEQQYMNQFIKQSSKFIVLTLGIYSCYLTSAIYHEKLLKSSYKKIGSQDSAYFDQSLLFTIFPPFIAALIGYFTMFVKQQKSVIPFHTCLPIAAIININMYTYNLAVIYASFSAVVMAKSCSLLSVIIVGVFFSGVKDSKLQLTKEKLLIGFIATFGIILFNFFKHQQKSQVDRPIKFISLSNLFLIISLIGDGFLPDFQAQVKAQYKPTAIDMYSKMNTCTFLVAIALAVLSKKIIIIFDFLLNYEDFGSDVLKFSLLNAVGQLFIYQMIKQFRQHIPAFVIAFRKCLTVIVNIFWFHHDINKEQFLGVSLVFGAVMLQVYSNYKETEQKKNNHPIRLSFEIESIKLLDETSQT